MYPGWHVLKMGDKQRRDETPPAGVLARRRARHLSHHRGHAKNISPSHAKVGQGSPATDSEPISLVLGGCRESQSYLVSYYHRAMAIAFNARDITEYRCMER